MFKVGDILCYDGAPYKVKALADATGLSTLKKLANMTNDDEVKFIFKQSKVEMK